MDTWEEEFPPPSTPPPSIAISGLGFPHISWIRGNELRYAHRDDFGWHKGVIATNVKENTAPCIDIHNDAAHVVWADADEEIWHKGGWIWRLKKPGRPQKTDKEI